MASSKVSALAAATDLVNAYFYLVQGGTAGVGGTDKKASSALITNLLLLLKGENLHTANFTLTSADRGVTQVMNKTTSGTVVLDTAATLGADWAAIISNIGVGSLVGTISGGAAFDDGTTSFTLLQGQSMLLMSNGTVIRLVLRGGGSASGNSVVTEEFVGSNNLTQVLANIPAAVIGLQIGTTSQPPSKVSFVGNVATFGEAIPTGVPWSITFLTAATTLTFGDKKIVQHPLNSGTGPYDMGAVPASYFNVTVKIGGLVQSRKTSIYTVAGQIMTLLVAPGPTEEVETIVEYALPSGTPGAGTVGASQLKASGLPVAVGMVNGTLAASRTGSAETYSLKTLAGTDPTVSDPVYCIFNDGAGGYAVVTVSAALSVTIPSTKHTGAASTTAFRNWIGVLNNAGAAELFVQNCSDANGIVGIPVSGVVTTTAISGANSAKVPYSTVARTAKQAFWLGWAEYPDTMTQGTWNTAPTFVHLQQTNDPTPGKAVGNSTYASTLTASATTANTMGDGTVTGSITPTSKANIIQATAVFGVFSASTAIAGVARMYRGGVAGTALGPAGLTFGGAAANCNAGVTIINRDRPGSISAVTYTIARASATSGQQVQAPSGDGGYMHLEELMG